MAKKKITDTAGEFVQPVLDGETVLPETNEGATDELSLAVLADASRNAVILPEVETPPAKYGLEYVMDGARVKESHITVEHAVARVRVLKMFGINPITTTL